MPGTFAIAYERIKRPESEMARLTHNDYLEQASDSGIAGAVLYTVFVCSAVGIIGRRVIGTGATRVVAEQAEEPTTAGKRMTPGEGKQKPEKMLRESPDAEKIQVARLKLFATWLGLVAWALHSTFDFGLYVPALSWIAFTFCGFLLARTAGPVEVNI